MRLLLSALFAAGPITGLQFEFPSGSEPQPLKIKVNDAFLELTTRKVADYRPTRSFSSSWSIEGAPTEFMTDLADYWTSHYNWSAVQDKMNRNFNHYSITVPGNGRYTEPISIHYVHHKSHKSNATPILLLHGWMSTYLEWERVIPKLLENGFDVVAADLPGFGFSPAPTQSGMGPREMGVAFDSLMKQLGYARYGLGTTDLGWMVGMWMVSDVGESILGHYTNFFPAPPEDSDLERLGRNETTQEETMYMMALNEFSTRHAAYSTVQGQKPLALALAMTDSPVGFAGWMHDLRHTSADGYNYTHEEIITATMMLWIQEPYGSMRAYWEFYQPDVAVYRRTLVPTGVTQWGSKNGPYPSAWYFPIAPRDWIERTAPNLLYLKNYEFGGHFPAVSQPDLWAAGAQDFFHGVLRDSRLRF